MRNICKYILLAGVAFLAAACDKDSALTDGQGAVSFDIHTSVVTRSGSQFDPETLRIRIYDTNGLIRRYTSLEEMPIPLYLVAGTYTAKIEAGDMTKTAFKAPTGGSEAEQLDELRQSLCYYAEEEFTVAANTITPVVINAPTINSKLTVGFDEAAGENSKLQDVNITVAAVTTTATTVDEYMTVVDEAKAPKLEFDGAGEGYFIMPNGVTTLVWAFEATHDDDGAVAKVGTITNVEAGKGYKVNFKYSRTPDGEMGITVLIDDTTTEIESDFNFKAQPQISGIGVSPEGVNVYTTGNTVDLQCGSIYPLHTLGLKVGSGNSINFLENGESVANAITGLTVNSISDDKMTVEFSLSPDFWAAYPHATQNLQFTMIDKQSETQLNEPIGQTLVFKKRGLVVENIKTDLWLNTTSFEAFVPEEATSVQIQYRETGTADWHTLTATDTDGDKTFTVSSIADWGNPQTNVKDKTYYNLNNANTSTNFIANRNYECKLVVDGVEDSLFAINTNVNQPIPDGDFSNGDISCFKQLHNDGNATAYFWGSGNNNMTSTLCTYNNGRAYLKAEVQAGFLASGNLFTGQFEMTSSTMGAVSFGVDYDWKARPTALQLDVEYSIGSIDIVKHGGKLTEQQGVTKIKGDADEGSIYVCVIDWPAQHSVASGGEPGGVWSPENGEDAVIATAKGKIIGYGIVYPNGTSAAKTITIPINYYNTQTKPSNKYKLIIMASTSRYGDYMVGCKSNKMYIDNLQWVY